MLTFSFVKGEKKQFIQDVDRQLEEAQELVSHMNKLIMNLLLNN